MGLTIRAGLNLDATSDQGDGETGRCIYTGTIGKLMPFALVIGTPAHASYPFEGQSAVQIAAEILARIEANPALADTGGAEPCPPPICLEARSLREAYEVTSPAQVWLAFNWLYHSLTPTELMARFAAEVEAAAGAATRALSDRAAAFASLTGVAAPPPLPVPRIVRLAELLVRPDAEADAVDNPLAATRAALAPMVEELSGPVIILGIAGLHYPPTRLDPARTADRALEAALQDVTADWHREGRPSMALRPIFTGISDMSFFGQPAGAGADLVVAKTAVPRLIDRPLADALAYPVVNIGPWGREFHQALERLYTPYAYRDLPEFLFRLTRRLLEEPASAGPGQSKSGA
jgi:arginine utilization protein RocB